MAQRKRPDRGAAAVEAALVLPLLLVIIFGIIDFGRMLNAQIKVTEAAREGARASSLTGTAGVRARVETVMGNMDDVDISNGASCTADADAEVTVSYEFQFVTPFAALAGVTGSPIMLTSTGVMPCRA